MGIKVEVRMDMSGSRDDLMGEQTLLQTSDMKLAGTQSEIPSIDDFVREQARPNSDGIRICSVELSRNNFGLNLTRRSSYTKFSGRAPSRVFVRMEKSRDLQEIWSGGMLQILLFSDRLFDELSESYLRTGLLRRVDRLMLRDSNEFHKSEAPRILKGRRANSIVFVSDSPELLVECLKAEIQSKTRSAFFVYTKTDVSGLQPFNGMRLEFDEDAYKVTLDRKQSASISKSQEDSYRSQGSADGCKVDSRGTLMEDIEKLEQLLGLLSKTTQSYASLVSSGYFGGNLSFRSNNQSQKELMEDLIHQIIAMIGDQEGKAKD